MSPQKRGQKESANSTRKKGASEDAPSILHVSNRFAMKCTLFGQAVRFMQNRPPKYKSSALCQAVRFS